MILLACEGKSEVLLMQRLLDAHALRFDASEILDRRPIHLRQLKDAKAMINILPIGTCLEVYRIGDTQKDEWDLSPFANRQSRGNLKVHRICTKPEIEILEIIALGLLPEYQKGKQKVSPKRFTRMNKACLPFPEFVLKEDVGSLVEAIHAYKRLKRHQIDEGFLADLLLQ